MAGPGVVVFDFNGTLSDDEPLLQAIFTELFASELGISMTRETYYADFAGRSDREIVVRAVGGADHALVERLLRLRGQRYRELVENNCPVRAGTRELVRALLREGHRLGIVTGARRADVHLVLSQARLADAFEVVVTEEDVTHGKPDPEGFRVAARRFAVDPADVLVFEDSVAGLRAARATGMRCIAVAGTADPAMLSAERVPVVPALGPELLPLLSPGAPAHRSVTSR